MLNHNSHSIKLIFSLELFSCLDSIIISIFTKLLMDVVTHLRYYCKYQYYVVRNRLSFRVIDWDCKTYIEFRRDVISCNVFSYLILEGMKDDCNEKDLFWSFAVGFYLCFKAYFRKFEFWFYQLCSLKSVFSSSFKKWLPYTQLNCCS